MPTPPTATTATRSPPRSSAPCRTAPYAVNTAQPRTADSSSGNPSSERKDVGRRHDGILGESSHRVHRDRRSVTPPKSRRAVIQRALQAIHREEAVAQVVASCAARRAESARHDERGHDLRSNGGTLHARSERGNRPRDLVPHHGRSRKRHFGLHDVQVGVTHAARVHFHEDLARARFGHRNLFDVHPARGALEDGGSHHLHPALGLGLDSRSTFHGSL